MRVLGRKDVYHLLGEVLEELEEEMEGEAFGGLRTSTKERRAKEEMRERARAEKRAAMTPDEINAREIAKSYAAGCRAGAYEGALFFAGLDETVNRTVQPPRTRGCWLFLFFLGAACFRY